MTTVQRLLASLCYLLVVSICHAESITSLRTDIAPQPLTQALAIFVRETGLQLGYSSEIAAGLKSKGAHAGTSAREALSQLLDGTGLRFEFLNERTVHIYAVPVTTPPESPVAKSTTRRPESQAPTLGYTLVTATRREEPVNKVPISIALWTEEAMEASGIKSIAELSALTPGITFGSRPGMGGDLYTDIAIRGVNDRHGGAVGIYLDDTKIPPARAGTYLRSYPLIFDLERVEVLRGPQSTLLGDHAQGGAVRFIPNQPSLTEFSGLVRSEWGTTEGGDTSYEVGAAAGGPIVNDVMGYRISGWYREDGGYVDRIDPFTGAIVDANSNRYVNKAVRAALTIAPAENVRIAPSLAYQSTNIRDTSTFDPARSNPKGGDLRNSSLLQQPFEDRYYLASLKITAGLHAAELSSVTSYFDRTATAIIDVTPQPPTGYADAFWWSASLEQRTLSEEVRLSSARPDGQLAWIVGAFYSGEHARHPEKTIGNGETDPANATVVDQTQLAAFGQITLRVAKHITASTGMRIGRSEYESVTEGPPISHAAASDSWTAPRFALSCEINEHNLLYFTAAKGYGSGGVYPRSIADDVPRPYPPDTLWSYEIGSKSDLADEHVHLDVSIFHTHWNGGRPDYSMVIGEQSPLPGAIDSNGFDAAVQALVTDRVKVVLGIAYADVRSSETLKLGDVVFIRSGDAVEGSPWSATASIEREFILRGAVTASVPAEDAFHGHESGRLFCADPASPFYNGCVPQPSSNVLNLRANVSWSHFDMAVVVNNALDSQPTFQPNDAAISNYGLTLIPRTISVSGTWRF